MKKLIILMIALIGLNTLTVFSQIEVSDYKLDWLFERNNDALRCEKELANCDSTIEIMEFRHETSRRLIINKDSIIIAQQDEIEIHENTIINQGVENADQKRKLKRRKFWLKTTSIIAIVETSIIVLFIIFAL